ncbi:uncharacterized protein LOC102801304 [Saccoglossus kowalevskii]|uniref:Multiple epidermal growth factor-like domains protein 6-like n=1 Tax=Saccoglossus kowalevskii TaxID=10224 RepID=A0ABM0LWE5_SACKO|nr:PREDICTED: multiple epidermal growth factor-like domains protein 6-like [Saccoglossus kowalevskii]
MGTQKSTSLLCFIYLSVGLSSVMSQFPVSPVSSSDSHACDYDGVLECCAGFYLNETNCVECPSGYYGYKCSNPCSPHCDTMSCDHINGRCECSDMEYYGTTCDNKCKCENGATCDRLSGKCLCRPTYWGEFCSHQCEAYEEFIDNTCQCQDGRYGLNCELHCLCYNGASPRCNRDTGDCNCPPGWTGRDCTDCDRSLVYRDTDRPFCEKRCLHCTNGDTCHPDADGACNCSEGWMGNKCETCDRDHYGYLCEHQCNCQNNAHCDLRDGTCTCLPNYWGVFCENECQCGSSEFCDHFNGCQCEAGKYGSACEEDCPCYNDAVCEKRSGQCQCPLGWLGPRCGDCDESIFLANGTNYCSDRCLHCMNGYTCHSILGECQCTDGWTGDRCDTPCTSNTYGINCQSKCQCMNNASCDYISGECLCLAGWEGDRCETPCDGMHYGELCRHKCQCENDALCSPQNGNCICSNGWTGDRCDTPCELSCSDQCQCQKNLVCVNGTCYAAHIPAGNQDASNLSLAIGLTVAFLLLIIAVTIAIVIIFKRLNCMKKRQGNYQGIVKATRRTDTMAATEQLEFFIDMGDPSRGSKNGEVVYDVPEVVHSKENTSIAEPVYAELEDETITDMQEATFPEFAAVKKTPPRKTCENNVQENEYERSWDTGGGGYNILGTGEEATHGGDESPYNMIDRTGKTYRPIVKPDSNYSKLNE